MTSIWPLWECLFDLDLYQSHHYIGCSGCHYKTHFLTLRLFYFLKTFCISIPFAISPLSPQMLPPPTRPRKTFNSRVSYVGWLSLETTASLFLCFATTTQWPHCSASPAPPPLTSQPRGNGLQMWNQRQESTHTHTRPRADTNITTCKKSK